MAKHVILFIDDSNATPASVLVEVLRDANINFIVAARNSRQAINDNIFDAPPIAVLCEIASGNDAMALHARVAHATAAWPGTPLVAYRRADETQPNQHKLDEAALKRLGLRRVANDPAQVPAILHELEQRGTTGDLPPMTGTNNAVNELQPGALMLPSRISARHLRTAFEIIASLHFAADQTSAAQVALAGLVQIIRADRWVIYLTGEMSGATDATMLEPLAARGRLQSEREADADDWRKQLTGGALMLLGAESQAARRAVAEASTIRAKEAKRRVIAVPLISGEKIIGVLEAVRESKAAKTFTPADAALLDTLALPLSSALANSVRIAEAERLSQTDDLTKLRNARYLRQFLISEVKRARRYNSSLAALFLDLDNFKQINDEHGHLVGSHVLMETAAVILSSVRDTDVVTRYGGDEFVVVLPETGVDQATRVAERVRERVSMHDFTGGRRLRLPLTASFGVAAFPQDAQSPQQLIVAADTAMYEAKAAGKNCIRTVSDAAVFLPESEKVIST